MGGRTEGVGGRRGEVSPRPTPGPSPTPSFSLQALSRFSLLGAHGSGPSFPISPAQVPEGLCAPLAGQAKDGGQTWSLLRGSGWLLWERGPVPPSSHPSCMPHNAQRCLHTVGAQMTCPPHLPFLVLCSASLTLIPEA